LPPQIGSILRPKLGIWAWNAEFFEMTPKTGIQEGSVEAGGKFARQPDFEYSACLPSPLDKSGGQQQNFLALDVSDLVGGIKGKSEPFRPGTERKGIILKGDVLSE